MKPWHGILVPQIVVHEVYSLRGVLPFFLASHAQPIELCLISADHAAVLAALPCDGMKLDKDTETVWTIDPSPAWAANFLASIERPASERLTSISVSFARLGALFRARLHVPGLQKLEIRLGVPLSAESDGLPLQIGHPEELFIRAPNLRRVAFTFNDEYAHSLGAHLASIRGQLATLRESFRALISYDAEILDAILVSREILQECAVFSHLAKEYAPLL